MGTVVQRKFVHVKVFNPERTIAVLGITVNPRLEVDLYYKSTSIKGRAIGGSVQALIIGNF